MPDPNPGGATVINVPGSFHSMSGTYNGTPSTAADGEWSGMPHDDGDDGVPRVATGTFCSTYDTTGCTVGAFGANVD